ncbi:uncharacterized protein I206_105614 [Kwoniella pini CBS 10737]|uniref:Uncharacterized protein n=1 Tax=Kwoniella pini CBS 10737 TaxID=1296096 RepID=A0A1B9I3S4_9TREE|nr:uncharacterized protein I206_03486 [Kwoniella pini CBS 10737]OCF50167.1 hypothetical protein I206_03486 [Kwoniella pini CBS 10737]
MSLLPQYKSDKLDQEENLPLWSSKDEYETSNDEENLPVYPPQLPIVNGSSSSNNGMKIHNITYTYLNRNGKKEEALGILGKTKEDTIEYVKRGFSELSKIPSERIKLQILNEQSNKKNQDKYISILDEAWFQFQENPPKSIKIQIIETPKEIEKRERLEFTIGCSLISIIIFTILYLIIRNFGGGSNDENQSKNVIEHIIIETVTATLTM